jgi:hypothetical protein
MDNNNLVIWWTIIVIVALSIDIVVYIWLRTEWKKRGVMVIDEYFKKALNWPKQTFETLKKRLPGKPQPRQPHPAPQPTEAPIVELIPVSVESIGQIRRVQFSMEMPLNTTMEVRIGATLEAGVKVEKREL